MKTGSHKLFFNRKNRWIPILLFATGFGMQIAGKWLPTIVVCYKANEKPKIEFLYDVCECRKQCTNHYHAGLHETGTQFQSSCLDVPLIADQGYGLIPRIFVLQVSPFAPARTLFVDPLTHFLFPATPVVGGPPPRSERIDNNFGRFFQTSRSDSLLCRFLC